MDGMRSTINTRLERYFYFARLKKLRTDNDVNIDCSPIENAFPNFMFPVLHDIMCSSFTDKR